MTQLNTNLPKKTANSTCCGCGVCAAICPNNSITVDETEGAYVKSQNLASCTNCGLCRDVCPTERYTKNRVSCGDSDNFLGNHIGCFISHSSDPETRLHSSSGGSTTALLTFMLKEKLIDGAIVTRMKENSPLEPEVIVARSVSEVSSAAGSKYCPVSVGLVLKNILANDGKYAVVGVPCQIYAFRKAATSNKKIADRIKLYIGLFCSHSVSFQATDFFLKRVKLPKKTVQEISYRGKRWPSGMTITTATGNQRFFPSSFYWTCFFNYFFIPLGCISCTDTTNEGADISIGDAWLPELKRNAVGTNVIIVRTQKGASIIEAANKSGVLGLTKVYASKIVQSQKLSLSLKIRHKKARFFVHSLISKHDFADSKGLKAGIIINPIDWLVAIVLFTSYQANHSGLQRLLLYTPRKLLRYYCLTLDKIFRLL